MVFAKEALDFCDKAMLPGKNFGQKPNKELLPSLKTLEPLALLRRAFCTADREWRSGQLLCGRLLCRLV